jgi:hypothetical protein
MKTLSGNEIIALAGEKGGGGEREKKLPCSLAPLLPFLNTVKVVVA